MAERILRKIVYVKEGAPIDARFRMFLNGLHMQGFSLDVISDLDHAMTRLHAEQFECIVVLSGCCYAEMIYFQEAIKHNDPKEGTRIRMIVLVHPEEEIIEHIRQDFVVAQDIGEFTKLIEIARYQLQEERSVADEKR